MAGGQGTRLRPLTSNQPKPMIPIANTPCMEHIVRAVVGPTGEDVQFVDDRGEFVPPDVMLACFFWSACARGRWSCRST